METLLAERKALGQISSGETRVLIVFIVTALLWITRGGAGMPGWSAPVAALMGIPAASAGDFLNDSIVAVAAAIALFVIPARRGGPALLNWDQAKEVPWGMLLLFGGGFALGGAFQESGLAQYFGTLMARWVDLPFPGLVLCISLATTFLTEVTSNTASMHLLMPILSSAAIESGIPPLHMMIPAVLSVSCAFMLPVATAPNAIVFATGKVKIRTMLRCGFVLNLVGVVVVLLVTLLIKVLNWFPGAS
jgi:sodium-dependent dicarboxylate transporter 2/3/5